jgi:hypothetical protein
MMKTYEIPSIVILKQSEFNNSNLIQAICHGIEEEGIPYDVETDQELYCEKLGYKAALQSRLDVGIGIGADGAVALHYSKLEEERPLLVKRAFENLESLKAMGSNAARLVKGIPFKNF